MTDFTTSDGRSVHLIGDPHLGKNFDRNCPQHRRGERALKQLAQFNEELRTGADVTVMVGDLFDFPFVSQGTVVAAARCVLSAAEDYPDSLFVMMAGNHDLPRNLSVVGAWTSFTRMLEDRYSNLVLLRRPAAFAGLAFFPWEWDRSAEEQVGDVAGDSASAAIGHWDLEQFDSDGLHMVPVDLLVKAFGPEVQIYSGHFHKPGQYGPVICTGSMQPYSHGEDPDNAYYITLTPSEALAAPERYRDKHIRLIVKPGEEIPEIDCLGVSHMRVRDDDEVEATISPADFDWTARLAARIAKLAPAVRAFIVERIPDVDPEKQRGSGSLAALVCSENGASSAPSV